MILMVAAGGALGAVSRHLLAGAVMRALGPGFPFGIMAVNILGSFLMGLLVSAFALKVQVSPEIKALLTVGFLGAFTTFSTFSLEVVMLFQRGVWMQASLYMVGSVALGVFGLMVGIWAGKIIL